MIDGYRTLMVRVSVLEKLKKIQLEKGYSSYTKAIEYLVAHWEESYGVEGVKVK